MEEIRRAVRAGRGVDSVSRDYSISHGVARRIVAEVRRETGRTADPKHLRRGDLAAVDERISALAREAIRAKSARSLRLAKDLVCWRPDRSGPVGVAFLADVHLGASGTNYDALERDLAIIERTPGLFVVIGGDVIDNHIKHLAATIAAGMTPGDQWEWASALLHRLAPRLIAIVGGNHEAWTLAVSGYEPLKHLAATVAVPYDADEIAIRYQVGTQNYLGVVRHKGRFNSTMNPSHAPKQHYRFGDFAFDFCVFCDQHQYTVEPFHAHGLQRWVLRPGSYQERSAFARARGYPAASPFSPVIVLRPDRRDLHGFVSIEWGAEMLNAQRARWIRRHGPLALPRPARHNRRGKSRRRENT